MDNIIEACARAAHEANRAYCIAIGDTSQPSWDEAPDWQQSSARNGVRGALDGATPEESHESWMAEKLAAGWKYGQVKDAELREHPCLIPYNELPARQRSKDALYLATVRAVGSALGYEIKTGQSETELRSIVRRNLLKTADVCARRLDMNVVHFVSAYIELTD